MAGQNVPGAPPAAAEARIPRDWNLNIPPYPRHFEEILSRSPTGLYVEFFKPADVFLHIVVGDPVLPEADYNPVIAQKLRGCAITMLQVSGSEARAVDEFSSQALMSLSSIAVPNPRAVAAFSFPVDGSYALSHWLDIFGGRVPLPTQAYAVNNSTYQGPGNLLSVRYVRGRFIESAISRLHGQRDFM